jgi:hypothetical protein
VMQYFLITMRVPSLSNFTLYPMPSVRYLIPCALLLGLYLAQLIPEILRRSDAPPWRSGAIALSLCALMLLGGIALQQNMFELFYQRNPARLRARNPQRRRCPASHTRARCLPPGPTTSPKVPFAPCIPATFMKRISSAAPS